MVRGVLDGNSADIRRGESIALLEIWTGKSSFVNLLVRFYDPTDGEVLINGRDIKEYNLKSIHKRLAFVTQRVYILMIQ